MQGHKNHYLQRLKPGDVLITHTGQIATFTRLGYSDGFNDLIDEIIVEVGNKTYSLSPHEIKGLYCLETPKGFIPLSYLATLRDLINRNGPDMASIV